MTLDDSELVAAARGGSRQAFDELLRRHRAAMYRLACRLLWNQEEAMDALQDALVKAWVSLTQRRVPVRDFPAWLYRLTLNVCRDRLRARKRQQRLLQPATVAVADFGQAWGAHEQVMEIWQRVSELPTMQREAFALRFGEELDVPEIAAILGCAPATVRVHLSRAVAALRRRLSESSSEELTNGQMELCPESG